MSNRLLRTTPAFELIGVKNTKGFELIKSGQLRSVKIGKLRLIPEDAITEFIESLEAQHVPESAA